MEIETEDRAALKPFAAKARAPDQRLSLTVAFAEYDRTRPLIDGRVKARGIDLAMNPGWIGSFCHRPVYEEYDVAEMSFDGEGRPALRSIVPGGAHAVSRLIGLPETNDALTPCWRCVRAGRGVMYCAPGECQCDYQVPASGCAA
jgi:hypothetical protein